MKEIQSITATEIKNMDYNELIGLTRETNRTPGGLDTIKTVSRMLMLTSNTRILDIGTSTGHTAIEFSRLLHSPVTGIDINEMSLSVAIERCKGLGLNNVKFELMDATRMRFNDGSFDVVFAGNVTSLIEDRSEALKEYWRVLASDGYLVVVPMYYTVSPSKQLLESIKNAIHVNIQPYNKEDWREFFVTDDTEVFEEIDYRFIPKSNAEIIQFCTMILNREHLRLLNPSAAEVLHERYIEYMCLFNENLSHMGFTIFALRRKECAEYNDPQLFFSIKK